MIYSEAKISFGFNVMYQADEFTPRFGLLVTAMSDPFDKTILSGFSVRHSPEDIKYIRIDNGVFDYDKYVVQTFRPVDIMIPKVTPPKPETYVTNRFKLKPGVSFRFLTDEANGDYTIVKSFEFLVDSVHDGKTAMTYSFKDNLTVNMNLTYNTPSVLIRYRDGELNIDGASSVNYSAINSVILNAIQAQTDKRKFDLDNPEYKSRNKFVIHFDKDNPDFKYYQDSILISVGYLGEVTIYDHNHEFTQYRIPDGEWVKIFYRQGLMIDPTVGLTHIREFAPVHDRHYIHSNSESVETTSDLDSSNVATVSSTINFNHSVVVDRITREWKLAHRYKWIEVVTYDEEYVDYVYDVNIKSTQYQGTDFDESYFGVSFSVNAGKTWLYLNDINNILVARFVSLDPVVVTPIDPKILRAIFSNGISDINQDYYPVDPHSFNYTRFDNTLDDYGFTQEYHDVEQALENLNADPKYLSHVIGVDFINNLIRDELITITPPPIKIAIVLQYYHDSNLITFQTKDVADLTQYDCIIAILETVNGLDFDIIYRDSVYQRMIPYAEWNDQTPSDLILNTSQLFVMDPSLRQQFECNSNGALVAKKHDVIQPMNLDSNKPESSEYAIVGNFNNYKFAQLKSELLSSGIRTAVDLYSVAFFKSLMLLYDFTYIYQVDKFMKNVRKTIDSTGLIYKDIVYLRKGEKVFFHVTLPHNVTRYMIVPIFSVDVSGTQYTIKANGELTMDNIELNARLSDISKLEIELECIEKTMLIMGFAVLYDLEEDSPNTLRINNQHNKQAPYLDQYFIEYDDQITLNTFPKDFLDVYLTYNLHLEDPLDKSVVDIFLYDKFIERYYELAQTKRKITIPVNELKLDDPKYQTKHELVVPFTIRVKNKFGENLYPMNINFYKKSMCMIYIRDYKIFLTRVDEVQNDDLSVTKYYNYILVVSPETCNYKNITLLYTKDYDNAPNDKIAYPADSNDNLIQISIQYEESDESKTILLELQNPDKSQYDSVYIVVNPNNS